MARTAAVLKAGEGVAFGDDCEIEDVGDEEVSGAGRAKEGFGGGDAEGDLEAEWLRRAGSAASMMSLPPPSRM